MTTGTPVRIIRTPNPTGPKIQTENELTLGKIIFKHKTKNTSVDRRSNAGDDCDEDCGNYINDWEKKIDFNGPVHFWGLPA